MSILYKHGDGECILYACYLKRTGTDQQHQIE